MLNKNFGLGKIVSILLVASLFGALPIVGISNVNAETISDENIENYIVYGTLVDKYGVPVDTAIVVAVNTDTGNSTWVYGENGTYSLDLGDINGTTSFGDTIKLIASNGICISNYTFTLAESNPLRVDFVLDPPEETNPSESGNPDNLSSPDLNFTLPEITTPEFKPDLILIELSFSDNRPVQGNVVTLTTIVTTTGLFVESFNVTFYLDQKDDEHYIASRIVTPSPLEVTTEIPVIWNTIDVVGYHNIICVVDPDNVTDESNETNNEISKEICVLTVEFLINESVEKIDELENTVISLLSSSDANKINNHLDHVVDWLNEALESYNENDIENAIKDLHHGMDETWKAIEETDKLWEQNKLTENDAKNLINDMKDVIFLIIEPSYVVIHTDIAKEITNVENIIVEIRVRFLFEKLSHDCDKVDNKLANALHHYQKAIEELAEDDESYEEIEHGYDKLLKAKEDVVDLVDDGKISEEFGNWITEQINNAILVFPPELSITPYDIVIETPVVKGYETSITITVRNTGVVSARDVTVDVYQESETTLISSYTIPRIDAGGSDTTTIKWTPTDSGTHDIRVVLDAENTVVEPTKEDNVGSSGVFVLQEGYTTGKGDWIIDGYTEINGGEILWPGNIIITSTGHLLLNNVNLAIDCGVDGQYSINVDQNGGFDVLNGSLVTGTQYPGKTFQFKVYGKLNVKNQSRVEKIYGDINAYPYKGGIQLYPTAECLIENSTIRWSETHNIYSDGASPRIYNSTVSWAGIGDYGNGIYCVNGGSPKVKNSTIDNNIQYGLYLKQVTESYGETSIENVTVIDNKDAGLYITDSTLSIQSTIIQENTDEGIIISNSSVQINNTVVNNNWFEEKYRTGVEISATESSVIITNSSIHGVNAGVFKDSNNITIINSTVSTVKLQPGIPPLDATGLTNYGLYFENSTKIHIKNSLFVEAGSEYCVYPAILFNRCSDGMIDETNITNCYTAIYAVNSSNVFVENNTITNCGAGDSFPTGNSQYAIVGGHGTKTSVYINNNNISSNKNTAIVIDVNANAEIINNTITNNEWMHIGHPTGCGIKLLSNAYAHIKSNLIGNHRGCQVHGGIYIGNGASAVIEGNTIFNNGVWGGGININYGFEIIIQNNTFYDNHNAISVGNIPENGKVHVIGNIFDNNPVVFSTCMGDLLVKENTFNGGHDGIGIQDSSVSISHNNISSMEWYGIYIYSIHRLSNISIENNEINGNKYGVFSTNSNIHLLNNMISFNTYGIYLNSGDTTMIGNNIFSNIYGVYSDGSNATILNNSINSNSYGVYYSNSDEGLISGNTIINHAHTEVADVVGMHTFYTSYGYGIFCQDASPMIKDDNLIARNLKGIVCNNSFSSISNNTIRDHNREYPFFTAPDRLTGRMVTHYIWMGQGVTEDSCIVDIHDNEFITNRADISVYNSTGIIESNDISGSVPPTGLEIIAPPSVGIRGYASSLCIANNTISDRHNGIYIFDTTNMEIFNNMINQNGKGAYLYNTTASLSHNNITENNIGVYLDHCPSVDFTGYNYVRDNYTWDLYSIASTWTKTDTDDIGNISST